MLSCLFRCCKRKTKQETRPAVHVLMPLYNAQAFVCSSVQSVLKQNYPNLKLLILDDGSTDNGLTELREYLGTQTVRDKALVHARSQNRGVCQTRNELLAWSREV